MKKKEVKKLHLSRETLRDLESSDSQKVVGGMSPMSWEDGCCAISGLDAC
jgi:hypothetical protein